MASTMKVSIGGSRAVVAGTPVRAASGMMSRTRSSVSVQAAADTNRREALAGVLFSGALVAVPAANAVTQLVPTDDRKAKVPNERMDEARDFDIDIRQRRGETQIRESVAETKKRLSEATQRLARVKTSLDKAYWTEGREELRLYMGYLRYDLNTLASTKDQKKQVKDLFTQVEKLDLALRQKNKELASKEYDATVAALDKLVPALT